MSEFKFNHKAQGLNLTNALALAEASELVYKDWDIVEDVVKTRWGFDEFKHFEGEFDTQAFMSVKQQILLLAFRGTHSFEDWKTDFKAKFTDHPDGRIHFGFNQSLGTIWDQIKDTFNDWHIDQSVWVTGHSLGGALGTLAAERLERDGVMVDGLYTFGQPMVGDKNFVKTFNRTFSSRCFRFVNDEDIVTKLPGGPFYHHTEKPCYLDSQGKLHLTNILWTRAMDRLNAIAGRSSEFATEYKAKNPGAIDDHGMKFYIKGIKKNLHPKTPPKTFLDYVNE